NVPLKTLVEHAYAVRGSRLIGGPGWISSDRFNINAKAAESAPVGMPQLFAMLRALLEDRFGLRVHMETRELPVYELMLFRDDRRVGPQWQPSAVDCGGYVPGIDQGLKVFNGARCAIYYTGAGATSKLTVKGRSMKQFVSDLEILSGRPVVDGTGLTGLF